MNQKKSSQDGQTMLEKLAVIMLMAVIVIGVYQGYCLVTDKASSHNMLKELNARIVQLRHQALTLKGIQSETEKQAIDRALASKKGSNIPIRVQSNGASFILVVGTQDYPLELTVCENLLKEYQTSKQQCFISGSCNDSFGRFEFSTHCSSGMKDSSTDSDLNCGDNAVKSAFGCACDKGYENWIEGDGCSLIELDCGMNAHQVGTGCVCDDGYEDWIEEEGCIVVPLECGSNAYQDGSRCVCDEGYENWTEGDGCSEACFSNGGACVPCTEWYLDWIDNESDCAICSNREVVRYTYFYNNKEITELYCRLKECPDGYFPDFFGDCYSCEDGYTQSYKREDMLGDGEDYDGAIDTIQEVQAACARCDNTDYPRIFDADNMTCSADCTGENVFSSSIGCHKCNITGSYTATPEECARCGEQREMYGKYCAVRCNAGYYRQNGNGSCKQCGNRQYVSSNKTSCQTCPAGQTHNSSHTGCQNCTASMTLGDCGCDADKVPDGNGGCQLPCASYANTSTTVRAGYQITGTSCYCVSGYILNGAKTACEPEDTCTPGTCMTCTNGSVAFKPSGSSCEQAGISGTCTAYGQCIPSGTSCSSATGCSSGYFCNYGGTYGNYSQGYTPNICEKITAQTTTINGVTYYYNTLSDLKSWCRPADGGKNCTWGYLAWYGAESWCKSQGKRLLTMSELQSVRSNLKDILPTATTTYWCSDGSVNISTGSTGSLGRKDGYASAGAVICR